jgi:hypothetical protein
MFRAVLRRCAEALDCTIYLVTIVRLGAFDWLAGPYPETPADRIGAKDAKRLREAFPVVAFDSSISTPADAEPLSGCSERSALGSGHGIDADTTAR